MPKGMSVRKSEGDGKKKPGSRHLYPPGTCWNCGSSIFKEQKTKRGFPIKVCEKCGASQ